MKHYFRRLFLAIIGRDISICKYKEFEAAYEKLEEEVRRLEDLHFASKAKNDEADVLIRSYQILIENQKTRLREKDTYINIIEEELRKYKGGNDAAVN